MNIADQWKHELDVLTGRLASVEHVCSVNHHTGTSTAASLYSSNTLEPSVTSFQDIITVLKRFKSKQRKAEEQIELMEAVVGLHD